MQQSDAATDQLEGSSETSETAGPASDAYVPVCAPPIHVPLEESDSHRPV